jgi:hypothetical protein
MRRWRRRLCTALLLLLLLLSLAGLPRHGPLLVAGSRAEAMAALLLALGGGTTMGIYPAFIKTPAVLAADVHPIVFQCYKSSVVFITGFVFMLPRYYSVANSSEPERQLYHFTYWALFSAAAWVPTGVSTIYAVPRIGMGMTTAVGSSTFSALSFVLFWLVFQDSPMKSYPLGIFGIHYCRAPLYLIATLLGIFAMVFSKELAARLQHTRSPSTAPSAAVSLLDQPLVPPSTVTEATTAVGAQLQQSTMFRPAAPAASAAQTRRRWVEGMVGCVLSGVLGTIQYAVVTVGQRVEKAKFTGCSDDVTLCPDSVIESFNTFGSWMVTFGAGALGTTAVFLIALSLLPAGMAGKRQHGLGGPEADENEQADLPLQQLYMSAASQIEGRRRGRCCWAVGGLPPFHWRVLRVAGVLAGLFWSCGNFLQTTAVQLGGNATVATQITSANIIASGLVGIVVYSEGGSARSKALWFAAALWTLVAMVLLGREKV